MKDERESGAIMIEGYLVLVVTTLMLIWILAVGFMYYEHFAFKIFLNDATAKIGATYNNPESDIVMGYMSAESIASRDLYRLSDDSELNEVNNQKVESYLVYLFKKYTFDQMKLISVDVDLVADSRLRNHVEVTATCMPKSPYGNIFALIGGPEATLWTETAYADCTDIIDYFSTVDFVHSVSNLGFLDENKKIKKVTGLIKSVVKLYNHKYAKK